MLVASVRFISGRKERGSARVVNITRDILHKLSANLIPFSFIPLKMLARPPETDHVSFSVCRQSSILHRNKIEKLTAYLRGMTNCSIPLWRCFPWMAPVNGLIGRIKTSRSMREKVKWTLGRAKQLGRMLTSVMDWLEVMYQIVFHLNPGVSFMSPKVSCEKQFKKSLRNNFPLISAKTFIRVSLRK